MARDISYYDTRDIFRGVRGTILRGKGIKERQFLDVVLAINTKIPEAILQGIDIILPYNIGCIIPMKMDTIVEKDGKFINRKTINWPETKKLGYYVRNDVDYRFKLVYTKRGTNYKNHTYMNFTPVRSLMQEFLRRAENKEFECYNSGTIWQRNTLTLR